MSKTIKILSSTVLIGAAVYLGGTYYVGSTLKAKLPSLVEDLNASLSKKNIPVTVKLDLGNSGFFSTQAYLYVESQQKNLLTFDVTAKHGPFAGFPQMGLAQIEATLIGDKGLQAIIPLSQTPLNMAINGSIGFSGASNFAIAMSAIDLRGNIQTDNITAVVAYEPDNSLSWQVSTPKLTAKDRRDELSLDQPMLKGQYGFVEGNAQPISALYHMTFAQGKVKTGIETELTQFSATAQLNQDKTNALLSNAQYVMSIGSLGYEELALDAINVDVSINNMPQSSLDTDPLRSVFTLPMVLNQSMMMNDEAVLSHRPVFAINAFNMSNSGGKFALSNSATLKPLDPKATSGNLPFESTTSHLVADKAFLETAIVQVMQTQLGMTKEAAQSQASQILEQVINRAVNEQGLLAMNETQITFDAAIKDNKATVNGKTMTVEELQKLFLLTLGMFSLF